MNRYLLLTLFLTLFSSAFIQKLSAQRQAETWHFGDSIAISFATGQPAIITPSSIVAFEGCVSYSDEQGNLLFYSNGGGRIPELSQQNGGTIWNRNHEVMYDMMGREGGGFSSRQSSIAFPVPGVENQYYLFTMEETEFDIGGNIPEQPLGRGLSYFIIDMTLNGSLGGVVQADQRVFTPSYEGLTAVPQADGQGFWVICNAIDDAFVVVPVTVDGVGEPMDYPVDIDDVQTLIKASPDGTMLFTGNFLFSFDPATGVPSEEPIHGFTNLNDGTVSFTPDSRYLYSIQNESQQRRLTRFDLQADDIDASGAVLAILGEAGFTLQMQIGPNGNIYFLEDSEELSKFGLSEIVCPSAINPQFNRFLIELPKPSDVPYSGLPNYVDAIFANLANTGDTIRLMNDSLSFCFGSEQTLTPSNLGTNYAWSTGQAEPAITVTESSQYQVTITGDCDPIIETFIVNELPEFTVEIEVAIDTLPCPGDSVDLIFTANERVFNAVWNSTTITESNSFRVPFVPNGEVTIQVDGNCGQASDTVLFPPPEVLTASLITRFVDPLCPGDQVDFSIEGDFIDAVLWEDSSRGLTRSIVADSNQFYQATVTNRCGDSLNLAADLDYSLCPLICDFLLPELITPNGDGVNDVFKVFTSCEMETYQLQIFNRWGQSVFESSDPSASWDGTRDGTPQSMDRYLYRVQFRFPNNPNLEQQDGSFSLIR